MTNSLGHGFCGKLWAPEDSDEGVRRRRRGSEDGDKEEALRSLRSLIALSVGPGEEGYRSGRPVFAGERGGVAFLLKTGEKRQERT